MTKVLPSGVLRSVKDGGVAKWNFLALLEVKRFNGPLPCLFATKLKHFGFSEILWLYGKLKSFIKAGQATMSSKYPQWSHQYVSTL